MIAKQCRGRTIALVAAVVLVSARGALAHPGHAVPQGNSWADGLLHPFSGLDHLLAFIVVGLLTVRLSSPRAVLLVPALYLGLMMGGAAPAAMGFALPMATWGVALSIIVLGLVVAAAPRVSVGGATVLVGTFAILHGHAHATQATTAALLPYLGGLFAATAALLAVAMIGGLLARWIERPQLVRFAGAGIAAGCALILLIG